MPLPFATTDRVGAGRLAARYVDDLVVLSDTHAWTYVRVPTSHYDFVPNEDRIGLASRFTLALTGLLTSQDPIDCHLLVTHRPLPVDMWAENLDVRARRHTTAPGWAGYLDSLADHLHRTQFLRREVFLGVCLGPRNADLNGALAGLIRPLTALVRAGEKALRFDDFTISPTEITKWRTKATELQRSLAASHLKASRVHPNQIAWLISKPLWPAMECPSPTAATGTTWRDGDLVSLGEGLVENGHRTLRIEQIGPNGETWEGYTAGLALSRFPDVLHFPATEPWVLYASSLEFPVDVSLRFTLVPPRRVHQDVKKKLADARDQASHIAEAGIHVPLQVQEALDSATVLEYAVDKHRTPWVYGRYRLHVAASDADTLATRCRRVIEHYRDLNIDVTWPTGDQFNLLCEAMPGDRVRAHAYEQRQEAIMIAGGMANASVEVGDRVDERGLGWVGPYLGYTTSRTVNPVFLSPHAAIARDGAPGLSIIGAPGGGKSFSAFSLAYQMALQGIWTIYIDPKADALPMATLPGLGNPQVFDLRAGHDGMLDPFALGDDIAHSKLLALETIRLLLGGDLNDNREEALSQALEWVAVRPDPSLSKVVDVLAQHPQTYGRNLASVLRNIRDLPFARLCFAPSGGARLRPEDGLTIVTLLGLTLPPSGKAMREYGYEERLAVSVMYLLTRYARQLMLNLDKSHPKSIMIDESWAITSTPQGAQMIPEVARMGRSHNTALVLVTQNAGDLLTEGVTNSISTKLAFRSTNINEINNVLSLFGLEHSDENRELIRNLRNGECLMQDLDRRVSRVRVDAWNEQMFDAFNTNPETRGKSRDAATATVNPWDAVP